MKYIVHYDYELPGWDEFNHVKSGSKIVEANSPEEAKEFVLAKENRNREMRYIKGIKLFNVNGE